MALLRMRGIVAHLVKMSSERERVAKLENRAKEAEGTLQQLKGYLELLKTKAKDSSYSAEAQQMEAENAELLKEVARLKQELIMAEISNGVVQNPLPANTQGRTTASELSALTPAEKSPSSSAATVSTNKDEPTTTDQATPTTTNQTTPTPKEQKTSNKMKAPPKENMKGGGGERAMDVSRLNLKIGKILKAWKHPEADGLYIEEVDVGEEGKVRTVCSGLVGHVPLEKLQGRLGVFLCNLKTAKMRGVPSAAMIMCASTPELVEVLDPPVNSVPGDRVICPGYDGEPDAMLNPKKKIFEAIQPDLHTNEDCVACYKGTPFQVADKGVCLSQTLKGTKIK